jgi:hypothetical protein
MRDFMTMTEALNESDNDIATPLDEPEVAPPRPLVEDLLDVVFKLRSFTESQDGEVGFGIELGMQRAADMIENVIARHFGPQGV